MCVLHFCLGLLVRAANTSRIPTLENAIALRCKKLNDTQ